MPLYLKLCGLCNEAFEARGLKAKYCHNCFTSPQIAYNQKFRASKKFGLTKHFTAKEWVDLYHHSEGICLACRENFSLNCLSPDHVIPLTKGGSNTIDNIQPLCDKCNLSKNNRVVDYRPTTPIGTLQGIASALGVKVDDLYEVKTEA